MKKTEDNIQKEEKKKRVRRTKETVETLLMDSAVNLIEKHGFSNLTVTGLVQNAGVEAAVFYNRYQDMNEFLDKFVRKYDYWLNDSINLNFFDEPQKNVENLLVSMVDAVNENKIMQQLLAWEITETNYIIQRTVDNREKNFRQLMEYFNKSFENADFNFASMANLITSGIYFILLHKNHNECKISKIDFNTREGIDLLKDTVRILVNKVFKISNVHSLDKSPQENELSVKIECAKSLIRNKVDKKIIKEATGLSDEILLTLGL
jgi:AcrR family transcriptional regulator